MKRKIVIVMLSATVAISCNFCLWNRTVTANPGEEFLDEVPKENIDSDDVTDVENVTIDSIESEQDNALNNDKGIFTAPEEENIQRVIDNEGVEVKGAGSTSPVEVMVPIYNYEIDNVVVPTTYAISLNPYEMPIKIRDDIVSTDQVVSWNYGMINKSTTDKIVNVTLVVEDLNKDKIVFVDSEEAAKNADENTYAVYLAVIPAAEGGISVAGSGVDKDTLASTLSNVDMIGAKEQAVPLHAGENHIAFKLSKATYDFGNSLTTVSDAKPEGDAKEVLKLISLNPDGKSTTAFTFGGAMNPKAKWGKLVKGVKITAVYDYNTATGEEGIINGTHAMIAAY